MYFAWRNLGGIDGSWLDLRSILGHADELAVFDKRMIKLLGQSYMDTLIL